MQSPWDVFSTTVWSIIASVVLAIALVLSFLALWMPYFVYAIRKDLAQCRKELTGFKEIASGQLRLLDSIHNCLSNPKPQGLFNMKGDQVGKMGIMHTQAAKEILSDLRGKE